MMLLRRVFCTCAVFLFLCGAIYGQGNDSDFLRSMGKMYVVVAVITIVFVGLIIYLIRLERRIGELEKKQEK